MVNINTDKQINTMPSQYNKSTAILQHTQKRVSLSKDKVQLPSQLRYIFQKLPRLDASDDYHNCK